MPIREQIQTGEYYHVYNRGVEKRNVFCERIDHIRFIHDLFEFNDTQPAPAFDRRYKNVGDPTSHIKREKLVEIAAFCLMSNHYHLLVRPLVDDGLSYFMKKIGGGYTMAFNEKNKRVGPLFQGRYKAKHVDKEEYLKHLVCYIHLNPLKFSRKFNKNGKINLAKTWDALNKYRWSSHLDYLGEDNFGSVIEKQFILDVFGTTATYVDFLKDWMRDEVEKSGFITSVAIDFE